MFTDEELAVRQQYFVRVKVNALDDRPESNWSISRGFSIRGVQKLYPILSPNKYLAGCKMIQFPHQLMPTAPATYFAH